MVADGLFVGSGAAASQLRAYTWSASPVGEPAHWPACVRTAIVMTLAVPTPAVVVWRGLAFANDAFGAVAPHEDLPRGLRDRIASLDDLPGWLDAGYTALDGFGIARAISNDDGFVIAVVVLEDRASLTHRLRQPIGPMLLAIDGLRRRASAEALELLDEQVRHLAGLVDALGQPPALTIEARPSPPSRRHRILVIEDDDATAHMLRDVLVGLGHQVELAHDAAIGFVLARELAPDVVLVDVGLPVVDGWKVPARIRVLPIEPPRFISFTARIDADDHARSREAGFEAHYVKPLDAAQLKQALA